MDFFEDLFERKSHHRQHPDEHFDSDHGSRNSRHYGHENHEEYHHGYRNEHHSDHDGLENLRPLLSKVLKNKHLLFGIIISGLILFLILVMLIIAFLPALTQVFETFNKHGIKGLLEFVFPVLQKIWEGQNWSNMMSNKPNSSLQ